MIFPLERLRQNDETSIAWNDGKLLVDYMGMNPGEFYRMIHSGNKIHQLQCFDAVRCSDCNRKHRLDWTELSAERAGEYFGRFSRGMGKGFLRGIIEMD